MRAGVNSTTSGKRSIAAFTMVEIALCLAIIGFALVAIIGVLPAGMSVQKDNREQTIINMDSEFLMSCIRSGSQGQDNLTNFIVSITNIVTLCDTNGVPAAFPPVTNWYTTNRTFVNGTMLNFSVLTNGVNIVGLLTTPKFILNGNGGYFSNSVSADFRSMSGLAVDMGQGQASRDFAFTYRVFVEIIPAADYAYNPLGSGFQFGNWVNAPGAALPDFAAEPTNLWHFPERQIAENMQGNVNEIRLRYRWPVLPNGRTAPGNSLTFRSAASGMLNNVTTRSGLKFYYVLPQRYQQLN
jgi:type II secretory pathway pseudopilin PulG